MNLEHIQNISLDIIDPPAMPMRSEITPESVEELARDIKAHGLIQPITVRPTGKRFEVVAGHRRFRAAKIAGLALIPCVVRDLTENEADDIKVRENLYREDVNPIDEAKHIHYLIARYEYEPEELAERLGKSKEYLISRYELLQYPDYLQDAIYHKQVGLTSAQWLVRITNENVRRDYTRFAISGGITAKRAEAWYRSFEAGNLPREPQNFSEPQNPTSAEDHGLYFPCVLCGGVSEIRDLEMYYGHLGCRNAAHEAHLVADKTRDEHAGV